MPDIQYPIRFSIDLTPVTKKNHQNIYKTKDGKRFVSPSKQYQNYEASALWMIPKSPGRPITDRVNIQYRFVMPTRCRCDLTNLEEAIDDILVKAGLLADDRYAIIAGHDGSRVVYRKGVGRTDVIITPLPEEEDVALQNFDVEKHM